MTPKDIDQIASEVSTLWSKHDKLAEDIRDLRESRARADGKVDALLDSLQALLSQSNCKVHGERIQDTRRKVESIEKEVVRTKDLKVITDNIDSLEKNMVSKVEVGAVSGQITAVTEDLGRLRKILGGISLLILAQVLKLIFEIFSRGAS